MCVHVWGRVGGGHLLLLCVFESERYCIMYLLTDPDKVSLTSVLSVLHNSLTTVGLAWINPGIQVHKESNTTSDCHFVFAFFSPFSVSVYGQYALNMLIVLNWGIRRHIKILIWLLFIYFFSRHHFCCSHPTSCCSVAEIMSVLFFHTMKYRPEDPRNPNNDRFILSKVTHTPIYCRCMGGRCSSDARTETTHIGTAKITDLLIIKWHILEKCAHV